MVGEMFRPLLPVDRHHPSFPTATAPCVFVWLVSFLLFLLPFLSFHRAGSHSLNSCSAWERSRAAGELGSLALETSVSCASTHTPYIPFSFPCGEPAGRSFDTLLVLAPSFFSTPSFSSGERNASAHAGITAVVRRRKPLRAMAVSFLLSASVLLLASLCRHAAAQQEPHDDGCIHMPIVHSTNANHFTDRRGVQLQLANRSDVAYYAQRMLTPNNASLVVLVEYLTHYSHSQHRNAASAGIRPTGYRVL